MRSDKIVLLVAGALVLLVLMAAVYYAGEVYEARRYTRDTLMPRFAVADYPLSLAEPSPRQREILLKVEDPAFYSHGGVDLTTPGAWLTTITQGLVKLLYFEKFEPDLAKIRQTMITAWALDHLVVDKDE